MSRHLVFCTIILFAAIVTGCSRVLRSSEPATSAKPVLETDVNAPLELSNVNLAASKAELALFTADVEKLKKARDFDGLDAMAARFRDEKERFIGGGWKIHAFYDEVSRPSYAPEPDEGWRTHLAFLQAWKTAKPDSITPRCALMDTYIGYAGFSRGDKYAKDVPDSAWRVYYARLDLAADEAKEISDPQTDPYGYFENLLVLAKCQGWDHASFDRAFGEAVQHDPTYPYFYGEKAVYLLPRWSGAPGEWEQFALQTKNSIGGDEGFRLYYLIVADISPYFGKEFFDKNRAAWADIKRGFQISVKQYGSTVYRMNQFGALAFNARDPQATCKTFEKLTSDDFDDVIWKNKEGFEERRKLAQMMCMMPRADNMRK